MLRGPGRFFNWPASDGVGGVPASGGGGPRVVAGLVLLEFPSGGLFEVVVVVPAAGHVVVKSTHLFLPRYTARCRTDAPRRSEDAGTSSAPHRGRGPAPGRPRGTGPAGAPRRRTGAPAHRGGPRTGTAGRGRRTGRRGRGTGPAGAPRRRHRGGLALRPGGPAPARRGGPATWGTSSRRTRPRTAPAQGSALGRGRTSSRRGSCRHCPGPAPSPSWPAGAVSVAEMAASSRPARSSVT